MPLEPDVHVALSAYAQGLFPMDDEGAPGEPLPFYTADPRCVFDITPAGLGALRRKVRRSLARDPGWTPAVDRGFEAVLTGCMAPRGDGDGVWLSERLADLYRRMHAAGFAHSFELWAGERLAMGAVGVVLGRAAMLESMFHTLPHAGNVGLVRTLEGLAAAGIELCDIQLPTEHTLRLGAQTIPAEEYTRRLRRALA
jgi:leucyl/phenylalanyl-tRNA---protein transferase